MRIIEPPSVIANDPEESFWSLRYRDRILGYWARGSYTNTGRCFVSVPSDFGLVTPLGLESNYISYQYCKKIIIQESDTKAITANQRAFIYVGSILR